MPLISLVWTICRCNVIYELMTYSETMCFIYYCNAFCTYTLHLQGLQLMAGREGVGAI